MKTCIIVLSFFTTTDGEIKTEFKPYWNGDLESCKVEEVYKQEDNFMFDPLIDNYYVRCVATDLDQCSKPED